MTNSPQIRPRTDHADGLEPSVQAPRIGDVPPPARLVLFVLWDGVRMLDIAGPLEVFAVADPFCEHYDIRTSSVGGRAVATVRGPSLGVDIALEDVEGNVDTLVIGGGAGYQAAAADAQL